jgi:predicted dehydrogenase
VRLFEGYERALAESSASLVYVSTVNADHARWVEAALASGRHVIVDKPAVTSIEDARRLVGRARAAKRCLAEAVVWAHHPQMAVALEAFARANTAPTRATAVFSFPPLDPTNFRYRKEQGGGAINDLGPYAVSVGRVLFGDAPTEIVARIHGRASEVEASFSVLATYPGGRCVAGHFGFDTEYSNRLQLLGPNVSVDLDRVFTPPTDAPLDLVVRVSNKVEKATAAAGDPFARFLEDVIRGIESGHADTFAQRLLADAEALDRLRRAAGAQE